MSLKDIKNRRAEGGFTLVELLIVIVVIAILVTIVVVAYFGITNNARNTKYSSDAASIKKVAEVIYAETGTYPATVSAFTTGSASTKLPPDITVTLVTAAPTNAAATTSADANSYSFDSCTSGGLKIYYPVRGGSLTTVPVGDVSAGCP